MSTANKLGSLFRRLLHEHSSNIEMKKKIVTSILVFIFLLLQWILYAYKKLFLLKLDTAFVILLLKKNNTYTSSHKKFYIQRIPVKIQYIIKRNATSTEARSAGFFGVFLVFFWVFFCWKCDNFNLSLTYLQNVSFFWNIDYTKPKNNVLTCRKKVQLYM